MKKVQDYFFCIEKCFESVFFVGVFFVSSSVRYHINPKTGNANLCRADYGNCPYEKNNFEEHYATKQDAQKAYETRMANPISENSRLMKIRGKVQQTIMNRLMDHSGSTAFLSKDKEHISSVYLRNRIDDFLDSYSPTGVDDSGRLNNTSTTIKSPKISYTDNAIVGFEAMYEDISKDYPELLNDMNNAGEKWIDNCSSDEAWAVYKYSCDSTEYAETYSQNDNVFAENLNNALNKAPKFSEPLTVFSGLSYQTRDLIMKQNPAVGSVVNIDRVLSTSVNPAQANGFMRGDFLSDGKIVEGKNVALKIIANRGGAMSSISRHQDEFEILLPKSDYEVVEIEQNKELMWGEGKKGMVADIVLTLRMK